MEILGVLGMMAVMFCLPATFLTMGMNSPRHPAVPWLLGITVVGMLFASVGAHR